MPSGARGSGTLQGTGSRPGLVAIGVLIASAAQAQGAVPEFEPGCEPPVAVVTPDVERSRAADFVVPAIESLGTYWAFRGFNSFVLDAPWAKVTVGTVARNLQARWVIDDNEYVVNQIGHPLQGSFFFTAARSSGLSFWTSAAYTFAGSVVWEVAGESEPPALNDQIMTSVAGVLLGEALYRLWHVAWGPDAQLHGVGAAVLATIGAPFATLNSALFPDHVAGLRDRNTFAQAWISSNSRGHVIDRLGDNAELLGFGRQVSVGFAATRGFPGPGVPPPEEPFAYFDLRLEGAFPVEPYGSVFVRGTLLASSFSSGSTHGLWGLFGGYDFSSMPLLRVSTSALGPGVALRFAPGEGVTIQTTAVASAVLFGTAGKTAKAIGDRDYHVGGGGQALLEVRLLLRDAGAVSAGIRNYVIRSYVRASGYEAVTYAWAGVQVRVVGPHALGIEALMTVRNADYADVGRISQGGMLLRLSYAFLGDESFGAAAASSAE